MIGSRHEIARLQSNFYCDQFRKMLRWLLILMAVMFMLISAIIYLTLFKAPATYYADTVEGKILNIIQIKQK